MISKKAILPLIFLIGCGLTKDLKDTRAIGKPYYKKLDEVFAKNANKEGWVMDDSGYSILSSHDIMAVHALPIKKSLFEQDLTNGALIGYAMIIARGNSQSAVDGMYEIRIDDVSDMNNVTAASLSGPGNNSIALTVTELDEYNELDPGDVCKNVLGGGCGAFYINFRWYCICVHPEIINGPSELAGTD